jgi:hypothetical protein
MKDTTIMLQALFFAHLLGDYVLQTDRIAIWKSRSVWGVLVHGGIVTFVTWLCTMPFALDWWPYALLIGAIHILIDVARTQIGKTDPATTLFLFLLDQALHALAIVLDVTRRIAKRLLSLALRQGERLTDDSIRITSPLTQGDLASLISASRESTNRALRALQRKGLLDMQDGHIILLKPGELSNLLGTEETWW